MYIVRAMFVGLVLAALASQAAAQTSNFAAHQLPGDSRAASTANRGYQLLAPPKIADGQRYPLVIYLHGAGSKGSENLRPAEEALPRALAQNAIQAKHPCFVLVPQCRAGDAADGRPNNWVKWLQQKDLPPAKWETADSEPGDQLASAMAALRDVIAKHPIDARRIYLAGVSMGASGAWYWAAQEPERFAGVIAVCGLSEPAKASRLKNVPIWAFHGEVDETVPVERTRQMVTALRGAGAPIQYAEYAAAGHNIAPRVAGDGVWDWLFAQRRDAVPPASKTAAATAEADFFESKIRPLLIAHCHKCHGPEKQEGNLRLDSRAGTIKGGDYGPGIVPGKPEEGWLIKAIGYADETLQMPPTGKLSATAVRDLTEWVRRGAVWSEDAMVAHIPAKSTNDADAAEMVFSEAQKSHWAFQPMVRPVDLDQRTISEFIDRQLTAGDSAAPAADKRTLLRRITLDLTGLPPTSEEMAAFLADDSTGAYQRVIERLLASPHYGERWGRHWLDVARYADSNGSEIDHAMGNAWRYRDYVVRSLNADKPFDRFVQEQVAGDLLPPVADEQADADRTIATGFLMLGPKALADLDKDRLLADVIDEQVDTVGRAFMGLTLGCCRCHDHKFDPLPTADYYALAGIFRSIRTIDVSKRMATWSERPLGSPADLARIDRLIARIGDLRAQRDAVGAAPAKRKLSLAADAPYVLFEAEDFTRANVRVERDSLGKGIGVTRTLMDYPDKIEYEIEFAVAGEYQLEIRYAAKESRPTQLIVNGNLEEMEAAAEVTGDWTPKAQRWFVQGKYPFQAGKNVLTLSREGPVPMFDKLLIGKPSQTPHSASIKLTPTKSPEETLSKQQLDAAIAAAREELEAIPTTMAPLEGEIADAPILARGNPAMPGQVVPRGFPRIVSGVEATAPGQSESGRRELAEWITQPDHPLTARVIVNRVWLWHFGEGLVRSPDNFGLRGEAPTHSALLDGLALWFVENGWSLKKLHRAICSTAAYQAASADDKKQANDPRRYFPRRRLAAEEIRDAMLAVSRRLNRTVGGSVMTVMNRTYANGGDAPPDIAKQLHYETTRRSLYVPIVRNAVHDFFAVFDYPEPGMLTGQRSTTTVAPQALFLMNSPFVKDQAAALADRVRLLADDDLGRVRAAYELVLTRPPSREEATAALGFLDADAEALAAKQGAESRQQAWARFCHALLASNDFLYVR